MPVNQLFIVRQTYASVVSSGACVSIAWHPHVGSPASGSLPARWRVLRPAMPSSTLVRRSVRQLASSLSPSRVESPASVSGTSSKRVFPASSASRERRS
eukprot:401899-Rhodomonas_salina.1